MWGEGVNIISSFITDLRYGSVSECCQTDVVISNQDMTVSWHNPFTYASSLLHK